MKRLLMLLLCLCLLPLPAPAETAASTVTGYFEGSAYLRADVGVMGRILIRVPPETPLTLTDVDGRYAATEYQGVKGICYYQGKVFPLPITDDTQPGGPHERTIEYVAPFDKCDRVEDYKTAWKFFTQKYGDNK